MADFSVICVMCDGDVCAVKEVSFYLAICVSVGLSAHLFTCLFNLWMQKQIAHFPEPTNHIKHMKGSVKNITISKDARDAHKARA